MAFNIFKKKFTQAYLSILYLSVFSCVLAINIRLYKDIVLPSYIFNNTKSTNEYIKEAESYWNLGDFTTASTVLNKAIEKSRSNESEVLGTTLDADQILNSWNTKQQIADFTREYWAQITKNQSDYRDAYLQLAYWSIKTNRINEAKWAIISARNLDPNNGIINAMYEEITKME